MLTAITGKRSNPSKCAPPLNIDSLYEHNALGEMLEAVDYEGNALSVRYDMLG